uniref:Uncharacterized protein n=1 Tax=Arundo donax TaxID=35708 RepID=A0A0A9GID9_ARUDO
MRSFLHSSIFSLCSSHIHCRICLYLVLLRCIRMLRHFCLNILGHNMNSN